MQDLTVALLALGIVSGIERAHQFSGLGSQVHLSCPLGFGRSLFGGGNVKFNRSPTCRACTHSVTPASAPCRERRSSVEIPSASKGIWRRGTSCSPPKVAASPYTCASHAQFPSEPQATGVGAGGGMAIFAVFRPSLSTQADRSWTSPVELHSINHCLSLVYAVIGVSGIVPANYLRRNQVFP
jgi:hypothetical protein